MALRRSIIVIMFIKQYTFCISIIHIKEQNLIFQKNIKYEINIVINIEYAN